ncbi:unnamed protein product [Pedinophyceae sp. YPF-701]|nr:unnamed protein product [Pedinophyceae sp. YPF-701]
MAPPIAGDEVAGDEQHASVVGVRDAVTPNDVLEHKEPTAGFLCPLSANRYGVRFREFKIQDDSSKRVLFHAKMDPDARTEDLDLSDPEIERSVRTITYNLPVEFLTYNTVRTMLSFSVGQQAPLQDFRMIERHYLNGQLIRSYDFKFGFCIPGSTNCWESIYDMPDNSPERVKVRLA